MNQRWRRRWICGQKSSKIFEASLQHCYGDLCSWFWWSPNQTRKCIFSVEWLYQTGRKVKKSFLWIMIFYNCTWEGVMSTLLLLELSVEWVFGATRLYWKRRFKSILLWSIGQQKMNYSSKKFFIWTNHPTRLLSGHFGYDVVFHDNTSSKFKFRS